MYPTHDPKGEAPSTTPNESWRTPVTSVGYGKESNSAMGTQPLDNFSEPAPPAGSGPTLVPPRQQPEADGHPSVVLWMHRISLVIYVIFCIEIGMLLAILPWTRVWTENGLVVAYPIIKAFLVQNFVRGAVTGIGLLDIWLGIWEAVHYRETPRPAK